MTCCGSGGGAGASMQAEQIASWQIFPNATTFAGDHMQAGTVTGTGTARIPTFNNLASSTRRIGIVSAAAINAVAGVRTNNIVQVVHGIQVPATGRYPGGGWKLLLQWAISDAALNPEARMFLGFMSSSGPPAAVDPATLDDAIGFGCDSGDTSLRLYARDNAVTTEIDFGVNFPVQASLNDTFYRGLIECIPGQDAVPMRYRYSIERLATGHRMDGEVSGGPRLNTSGFIQLWRSTGPVDANPVGIDISMMRLVTKP